MRRIADAQATHSRAKLRPSLARVQFHQFALAAVEHRRNVTADGNF